MAVFTLESLVRGVSVLRGGQTVNLRRGTSYSANAQTPEIRRRLLDSSRGVTVLFGGNGMCYQNDTWEWDGQAWLQRSTSGPGFPFLSASSTATLVPQQQGHGLAELLGRPLDGGLRHRSALG